MFRKAEKKGQFARIALFGPAGSGKTYSALTIGRGLVNSSGRLAVIDTERGSASKYADVTDFDVAELETFEPRAYTHALSAAASSGYHAVIVDSLSHAWEGAGGILDQVDKRGGRFDAWKDMTPQMRDLVDALLAYPGHVIVTMRSKTEYVVEKDERTGKSVPRKIGLAPRFKDGMEYEFDIVGELDDSNTLRVTKSRCVHLSGASVTKPGRGFALEVLAWLGDPRGAKPQTQRAPQEPPRDVSAPERLSDCRTEDQLRAWCDRYRERLAHVPRARAIAQIHAAAQRCGVNAAVAQSWAGLLDDVPASEPAQ